MAVYSESAGKEYATTSVRIPRDLFDSAKTRGLNMSRAFTNALERTLFEGEPQE